MPQILEEVDQASLVFQSWDRVVSARPDRSAGGGVVPVIDPGAMFGGGSASSVLAGVEYEPAPILPIGWVPGRSSCDVYTQAVPVGSSDLRGAVLYLVAVVGSSRSIVARAPAAAFRPTGGDAVREIQAAAAISYRSRRPAAWELWWSPPTDPAAEGRFTFTLSAWGREPGPVPPPPSSFAYSSVSSAMPSDAPNVHAMTVTGPLSISTSDPGGFWAQLYDTRLATTGNPSPIFEVWVSSAAPFAGDVPPLPCFEGAVWCQSTTRGVFVPLASAVPWAVSGGRT